EVTQILGGLRSVVDGDLEGEAEPVGHVRAHEVLRFRPRPGPRRRHLGDLGGFAREHEVDDPVDVLGATRLRSLSRWERLASATSAEKLVKEAGSTSAILSRSAVTGCAVLSRWSSPPADIDTPRARLAEVALRASARTSAICG